jgi:hypothetical protein
VTVTVSVTVRYSVSDKQGDRLGYPMFDSVHDEVSYEVSDAVSESSAMVGVTVPFSTQSHIHIQTWKAYEKGNATKNSDQILRFNLPLGPERPDLIARRQLRKSKARP